MVPLVEDSDVDIDDIPVLQDSGHVGDAVADHFVQTRAAGFGEAVVVERRGVGATFDGLPVDDHVDLVGGHPDFDLTGGSIEDLTGN